MENVNIEEMLIKNNFEEIAKGLKVKENHTRTGIMIDLSDGEVWLSVSGPGEYKEYDETIISIGTQSHLSYKNRNANYVKNLAKEALEMYWIKKMESWQIELCFYRYD